MLEPWSADVHFGLRVYFAKGARVTLSEAGRAVPARRLANRLGTVTGWCRNGTAYLVLWDGVRNPQPWHVDYLVAVDSPLTPTPPTA